MTDLWGPPPPFDEACAAAYEAMPPLPRMSDLVLQMGRALPEPELDTLTLGGTYDVQEVEGDGIPLVVARPKHVVGPCPVLYVLHSGGMVLGSPREGALTVLALLAAPLGLAVVSAGYRRAPDVQGPALAEDAYTGLCWLSSNAQSLGLDPAQLVLMGISGGGGLAASCGLMARDRHGPSLRGQLLMYPMLDDRNNTPSASQMAEVGIWRQADNQYAWTQVLGSRKGTSEVTYVDAAARADDLSGLPPTYLDAGSSETFRDEVIDYARRIWLAGGSADLHIWDGGFHGFDLIAPESPLGRASWQTKKDWLTRQLTHL